MRLTSVAAVLVSAASMAFGQNVLTDGSFEMAVDDGNPFTNESPNWQSFTNGFIFNDGEVPPEDGDVGAKVFGGFFYNDAILFDNPEDYDLQILIDDPDITDNNSDGNPERNGIELVGLPRNTSGFSTFVTLNGGAPLDGIAEQQPSTFEIGDTIRLCFYHHKNSSDALAFPQGYVIRGQLEYRVEDYPVAPLSIDFATVDIVNDPDDEWVKYTLESVIPPDTVFIKVMMIMIQFDFVAPPIDADEDGIQDLVPKDLLFDDIDQADGLVPHVEGMGDPTIDTDNDSIADTWPVGTGAAGFFPGGAAFFDNVSLEFVSSGPAGCNIADVAEPFGTLNIDDVLDFLTAFSNMDVLADVSPAGSPDGVFNIDDVLDFLTAFSVGCPL